MPNIKLKGQTGEVLTYEDVERVYFDSADEDGEVVYYTHGQAVSKTVEPNFASGDMNVPIADGELVTELTIEKPDTLLPENIRSGVTVAGVTGDLIGDTEEVTVDLDMADGGQVITPSAATKVMSKVVVTKPGTMKPENIRAGIDIGGVVGEFLGDAEECTVDLNFPSGDTEEVILAEQTLDGFALDPTFGAFHLLANPAPYELEADQAYTVVWDGEDFPRTAFAFTAADGASCVGIGNTLAVGGSDSGEPFCIVYDMTNGVLHYFSTEADTSHTAEIYQVTEGITDMVVTPSADGKSMSKVTITKPETLLPENVRSGIDVGGVIGSFIGDAEEATVVLDFTNGDQTVEPSAEGKVLSKAVITKPETLLPENIAEGVNIAGVVGALASSDVKVVVKQITGSLNLSGTQTIFTADELESIGFASASRRFALMYQRTPTPPVNSSWKTLHFCFIRYPYLITTPSTIYGISGYHTGTGGSQGATPITTSIGDPWSGTLSAYNMVYLDGAIVYNLAAQYRLSTSSYSSPVYICIAGCY